MSSDYSDEILQQVEDSIFSFFPHIPTPCQRKACHTIVQFLYDDDPSSTAVLRGYAGTGKTSLVSALIQTAPELSIHTVLLAPTGRAAKVLSNYSGQVAYTIHKKIYSTVVDANGVMHTVLANNKHKYTLFIVDEASMIDAGLGETSRSLLEDLLFYVRSGSHCRLMLIGDTAQLPPVGCDESPALDNDFLASVADVKLFDCELTDVVRQQRASGVLYNATQLRNQIEMMEAYDEVQMPLFETAGYADIVRLNGADMEEALNAEYSRNGIENVAVVCRSNKRANLYNQAIRNRLLYREEEISSGDYLMVVKNNYYYHEEDSKMGFIANGDIIEIQRIRRFIELYGFRFVDATVRFVDYPDEPQLDCLLMLDTLHSLSASLTPEESKKLYDAVMEDYADIPLKRDRLRELHKNPYYNALQVKYSYALTCHKTQGGQWNTIFVDQGYFVDDMLTREYLRWLYTALTRATARVYLLGFDDKFFEDVMPDDD